MATSPVSILGFHAQSLGGAAMLLALGWLLGGALLRPFRLPPLTRLERFLLATGLGLGVLSTVTVLIGLAGGFTPGALRVLLLIATAISFLLRRAARDSSGGPLVTDQRREIWVLAVQILSILFLIGLLPSVLTPMVDYDGIAYHVGAPKRWLELGRIAPLPTHLHTFWPMGEEMLNGLLLATTGDGSCKPLIFCFAAMGGMSVYALGERLATPGVGALAASIFLYRAGAPSINTTSVEAPLAFFVVMAALCLAVRAGCEEADQRRRLLIATALFAGFACATKLNGLLCLAFLIVAFLVLERDARKPAQHILLRGAAFGGIALAVAVPWYARAWWITGNPVFPFAYSVFGGLGWDLGAARSLALYFRTFDLPGDDVAQRALFVQRHLMKLTAMMAVGLALPSPRWVRGLVLAAGSFALIQVTTSDNPRFLLPPTAFAAIALAWWLVQPVERWRWAGWIWAAGVAALIIPTFLREIRSIDPVIYGGKSRDAFIEYYVNNRPAFEWANAHLPRNAKVLYGPDNRTYYLEQDVLWSSSIYQREVVYDSPEAFRASLRSDGVHWLILNRDVYKDSAISFETRMGWRADEKRRLEEAAASGKLLFSKLGVEVYELP